MSAELITAYRSFNKILKRLPVDKSLADMLSQVIELTEETFNSRQTSIFLYDDNEKKFVF